MDTLSVSFQNRFFVKYELKHNMWPNDVIVVF